MTVLRNNFDTGPNGTTITAANSGDLAGNDAFDGVPPPVAGGTIEYSSTFGRPTAAYTAHLSTGSTSGSPAFVWSTSMGSQTQIWFRQYVLLASTPTLDNTVYECDNGAVYCAFMAIVAGTSRFSVLDHNAATLATFSTSITLNTWNRLETRLLFSATVGNFEARLFAGDDADSDTPTEVLTGSSCNFGAASANSFVFGHAFGGTNWPHMYLSGLELNTTGWPGPAPFRPGKGVPGILTNPMAIHMN